MPKGRDIKSRIKSVKNTKKITKAMELVSASKMRKAVAHALRARTFARESLEALQQIAATLPEGVKHQLLRPHHEATKRLLVVFSSDRGLAGGLNVNLMKAALAAAKESPECTIEAIALGKRAAEALLRANIKVIAQFPAMSNNVAFVDILPIARLVSDTFATGEYRDVTMVFTQYISGITQRPIAQPLLPIKRHIEAAGQGSGDRIFEPSRGALLDNIIPRILETTVYQALLEATASEHAARMLAMKNATDAAKDMIERLSFTYNQARQAGITQEIAEISSGKAALE